jgi:hypothetical protein
MHATAPFALLALATVLSSLHVHPLSRKEMDSLARFLDTAVGFGALSAGGVDKTLIHHQTWDQTSSLVHLF